MTDSTDSTTQHHEPQHHEPPRDEPKLTIYESIDLLTGYDEEKIEAFFGMPIDEMKFIKQIRALHFVDLRRGGADDGPAYEQAMSMTQSDLTDQFAKPASDDEVDPSQDPETEQGKDTSLV